MKKSTARPYNSASRQQKALETRQNIANAAKSLFTRNGYDSTTIEQIADAAQVAVPTVYSVFGSKNQIVKELVSQIRFGPFLQEFAHRAKMKMPAVDRVKLIAQFVRNVNEASAEVDQLFRLGRVSAPEIVEIDHERNALRYESQKKGIQKLVDEKALKSDLTFQKARDILTNLNRGWQPHLQVNYLVKIDADGELHRPPNQPDSKLGKRQV
jgi:AcrR family transcriptional regulator